MTELILDEDLRFDPTQESQIARAIQTTLARDDLEDIATAQREHISSTFTWQNAAEAAIESMRRIPAKRSALPSRRVAPRPRIAIVGPLPPQQSGIADYTWRLLPDLTIDADVVCVVESDVRSNVPLPPNGVTVLTVQEFERMRRVHPFDETVIVMGNSSFHHYCWDLLNEMPATVLAHELRYTGLFQSYAALRLDNPGFFRNLLAQEYGGIDPGLDLETFLESDTAADMGIHLVGPIIDRASKFLTTSDYAARIARLIRPTRATDIATVGFAYPSTDPNTGSYKSTPPVLVSVGVQFPTKRTLDIVRALSIVRESHPGVCLRLVGPIDDWYEADVRELAQELGLRSAVTILGHVPEEQLRREIESASVAIQLRVASNGEVSAAIADCLVAGTPVVTTSIGAQGELADAGVELLDRSAAPVDIATAIVSILEDSPRQEVMAKQGRRWAMARDPSFAAHELLSALGLGSGRP